MGITLHDLSEIGPFLSGISFVVTAATTVATLTIINSRQMTSEWLDRFRNLYGKFWDDDVMAEVREWIINENSYKEIRDLLKYRNSKEICDVSPTDNQKLDKIDRFCALLTRVRSFGIDIKMTPIQEELWGKLLYEFWVSKIIDRPELKEYIHKHWHQLEGEVIVKSRENPFIEVIKLLGREAEEKKSAFLNFPRRPDRHHPKASSHD